MYTATLNELKAVQEASAQAGQSGAVNKISLESTAQDDDFREVKRRKRKSLITPHRQPRNLLNQSPRLQLPNPVLISNFFATFSSIDMDTGDYWSRERTIGTGGPQNNQVDSHK
jgi:hypothetical protein